MSGMQSTTPTSRPSATANWNSLGWMASLARPIISTASSGDTSASPHTVWNASLCSAMNVATSVWNRRRDASRNVTPRAPMPWSRRRSARSIS